MPWLLNEPIAVGQLDEADYTHLQITTMIFDAVGGSLSIDVEYGRVANGSWVSGHTPAGRETSFVIRGDDLAELVGLHMPQPGEPTYEAVKRGLYEWLAAHGHIDAGTVG